MRLKCQAGFTLIEVIVIAAILAILAGVLVPMVFSQIDQAKVSRAEADCKSISSAILAFRKDVGTWPDLRDITSCTSSATLLRGQGNEPQGLAAEGFNTTSTLYLKDVLMEDNEECYNVALFKGPYIPVVNADPWGNAYVLAAVNFNATGTSPVLALSAGPNGVIETSVYSVSTLGDDIGTRIK